MSFHNTHQHKPKRPYKIVLKSPTGNTVGHINLTSQFLKAVTGKDEAYITLADIANIHDGNVLEYLAHLEFSLEPVEAAKPKISANEY